MNKQIWKFEMVTRSTSISMPKDAKILSVQIQNDIACIWALVDPKAEKKEKHFEVFGTGENMECEGISREFIGTFQMHSGKVVFHVFERI